MEDQPPPILARGNAEARPRPFTLQIPDHDLEDLKDRLARTRLPDQTPGDPWSYGTEVAWLADIVAYWRDSFDWRAEEARLNGFAQFKVQAGGIDLHYLHVEGKGPNPTPLLLSHGWPGSVFEFLDIIPRLTDPAQFGGDPADAFTVIAPSLPGFGLSFEPGQPRFSTNEMADLFAILMTDVLGFGRFAAQGGDWGASITGRLGYRYPDRLIGIHLNLLSAFVGSLSIPNPTPEEQVYLEELDDWMNERRGYAIIQGTRPQTLAFGLTDSPSGLAAWIGEKFQAWSDGGVGAAIPRDRFLANVALYWFTGAIGSSFWPYYSRHHGSFPLPTGASIDLPAGYAQFPKEIVRPPRSVASRAFTDLRHWTVMKKGGHFAALEQPQALATDIQAFFRPLR